MNNEFYEHKRSGAVKWVIVFVLIAVLLAGMVAALVFAVPSADESGKCGNGDGLTDVSETTEGAVTLSAGIAFTASDPETGAKSVSKTITATVLPVDAPDKEDVGDYLSVTPQSDGALTATAEPDISDDDVFEEGCVYLTPETAPFPFAFDDEPQSEEQNPATVRMTRKDLFEQLYAQTADLPRKDRKIAIFTAMLPYFDDSSRAESYVNMQFERKLRNLICRRVRLTRKVNLQEFNYFCTFTYDDKLHDEVAFRKKLTNCLSLFSSRKKWRYIGVWERSPEKNRLHFHGVFHIPDGTMPGELVEVNDYSFGTRQRQVTLQNTYFNKRFGRSDFEPIDEQSRKAEALAYILKHIEKTGEKVVYSKGFVAIFHIRHYGRRCGMSCRSGRQKTVAIR